MFVTFKLYETKRNIFEKQIYKYKITVLVLMYMFI